MQDAFGKILLFLQYELYKMKKLYQYSALRINEVNTDFKRYLWDKVNWNNRLIIITGARGIGKTTFLLQYIKENLIDLQDEVIYVSLDDIYFSQNSLVDFADEFVKRGGKFLFIDEVHKYSNWPREIKNIYDYFSGLNIIITGSSALNIYTAKADLSRRAVNYRMRGLSFREYLLLKHDLEFPVFAIEDILTKANLIIPEILNKIKPIKLFEQYLQAGYYPFFVESEQDFPHKLKLTVNQVLETDLPSVEKINFIAVQNIKKLLSIITEIAPFKPNILRLSRQIEVSRETLQKYLYLLSKADLLMLLEASTHGISRMNKPEKIYLNDTNLIYSLTNTHVNTGTVRETFFYNQLKEKHNVFSSDKGDFIIDQKYTFEIGGKNKSQKQIAGLKNAFIAADNIEFAHHNFIPLWLFGFLY